MCSTCWVTLYGNFSGHERPVTAGSNRIRKLSFCISAPLQARWPFHRVDTSSVGNFPHGVRTACSPSSNDRYYYTPYPPLRQGKNIKNTGSLGVRQGGAAKISPVVLFETAGRKTLSLSLSLRKPLPLAEFLDVGERTFPVKEIFYRKH